MKKTLALIFSALLVAGMSVATMAWEKDVDYVVIEEVDPDNYGDALGDMYPGSLDWDWAECTSGQLLKGTIIAGYNGTSHCWENGTANAAKAFDGDTSTYFDPYEATPNSWCGMILDQAYELTEVRIMPRESWLSRLVGAAIQGSNDGVNWADIVYVTGVAEAPAGYDYHCFTPTTNADYVAYYSDYGIEQPDFSTYWVGSGSYQYYRYVNLEGVHGDTADIELYGNPAPATEVTADMTPTILISDIDNFYEEVENTGTTAVVTDGSIEGTVIGGGGAYSDTASYACAFDGDTTTFYDPKTAGPKCFTGIQTSEPYALTEVKIIPREANYPRTEGATIQGSNDGAVWTTLAKYTVDDVLAEGSEQTWISKTITDTNGYTMFRYVSDGTQHGDVAEVAFYGAPAAAAAATTTAAAEAPAAEATAEIAVSAQEYPSMDPIASTGEGYASLEDAAAAIGKTAITAVTYVDGTSGNANEGPENIWDNDTATKFCTTDIPTISIAQLDGEYTIDGIIMATANDNSSYNNRSPYEWAVYGSADGATWTALAYGDDYFFAETNFTYYAAPLTTEGTYKYIMFQSEGGLSGTFQMSELVVCGTKTVAEEPVVEEAPVEEAPVEEAPVEEAPVEEAPAEEVVEAPAEEVVEAPAEETVEAPAEAPATFDLGIVAAIAAAVSAAGYALSKKRS